MTKRVWLIRLLLVVAFTALTALITLFFKGQYILNYMNTSFIIGLILLMIAAVAYTVIYGFWDVFAAGSKLLFRRRHEEKDETHWSFDKKEDKEPIDQLRDSAKRELFIFLPLITGIALLMQTIAILFLI